MKRTLILWIVLIVLFVTFYQVFSRPPGDDAPSPPRTVDWSAILSQWLPIIVIFFGFIFFARYQQRRYTPLYEAHRLAGQGRTEQSLELFEKYRKAYPKDAEAAFNVGWLKGSLWKLGAARLEFEAAQTLKGKKQIPFLVESLALIHALLGNVGDARRVLTEVPPGKSDAGRINLVLAILLAREGKWAMAREKLGGFEVKQMPVVGTFARALDAWCIEKLTGELRHVDRLALFGGAPPDELATAWPEFMSFVERAPRW